MPAAAPDSAEAFTARLSAIGDRIRDRRKLLKVSATAAAEAAGLSRVTLHRVEHGEASVTIGAYLAAMDALGLDVDVVDKDMVRSRLQLNEPSAAWSVGRRDAELPATITLAEYPQLRQISWHVPEATTVSPAEAFGLYERHWKHVDADAMDAHERELLTQLTMTIGKGHLLV